MKNKYTITFSISILMLCSCSFLLGNDGLLEDCESVKTKCSQAFNASSYLKIIAFCFGYLSLGSRGVRTLGRVVRTRASNECSRRFHEVSQSRRRPSLVETPTSTFSTSTVLNRRRFNQEKVLVGTFSLIVKLQLIFAKDRLKLW